MMALVPQLFFVITGKDEESEWLMEAWKEGARSGIVTLLYFYHS